MGQNIVFKILQSHLLEGQLQPNQQVTISVDQTLFSDLTGIMAGQVAMALPVTKYATTPTVFYCDHNTLATTGFNADDHIFLKTVAARYGAVYSKPGNGICHFLHCQRFAAPGKVLLGADSHTPTSGALGMLAIGSGGLTVAKAALGEGFKLNTPKVLGVKLTGKRRSDVSAKDIALKLLSLVSVKGGIGYIVEYFGDALKDLSVPERQTIANMSIEIGATTGIFPSDEVTQAFLEGQGRGQDYAELLPDEDCTYDKVITIDLNTLEPLVAQPDMPDNVCTVKQAECVIPNSVFIGSCTNASYSDLARAAYVLRGHKVSKDLDCTVACGSRQVLEQLLLDGYLKDFVDAGCRVLECACGPCIGVGQVPCQNGIAVRTSNRNFPGRSGNNSAVVYLTSPEVAAATMIAGHIASPEDYCDCSHLAAIREPEHYTIDDSGFIYPEEIADPSAVQIIRGPNISELPMRGPVAKEIRAQVSLKLGDNVTTDDIIPGGSDILQYISNFPKFAEYTFCYTDPTFVARCKELKHNVIVGGDNYGQGSSREFAAMLPMLLGTEAVITKNYARIHKENLFNYGILPLQFKNEADYELISQGDNLQILQIEESIESGQFTVACPEKGYSFQAVLIASDFDKKMLLCGGAMNILAKKLKAK